MIVSFQVLPSLPSTEPTAAYFADLVEETRSVLGTEPDTPASVWSMCEYLDCVDAGDLLMDKRMYTSCVQRLGAFLTATANCHVAKSLARKSWAARTLRDVMDSSGVVVELSTRRLSAA